MSASGTRALITNAVERLQEEVPALRRLTLVVRVELRARGHDAPIWRVEVPGPTVSKDPAGDARIDVSVSRTHFNELAESGRVEDWARAYERGHIKVSGDAAVIKLLAKVIERYRVRTGAG